MRLWFSFVSVSSLYRKVSFATATPRRKSVRDRGGSGQRQGKRERLWTCGLSKIEPENYRVSRSVSMRFRESENKRESSRLCVVRRVVAKEKESWRERGPRACAACLGTVHVQHAIEIGRGGLPGQGGARKEIKKYAQAGEDDRK